MRMWQLLPQLRLIEELLSLSLCKIWLQSHAMVDMVTWWVGLNVA